MCCWALCGHIAQLLQGASSSPVRWICSCSAPACKLASASPVGAFPWCPWCSGRSVGAGPGTPHWQWACAYNPSQSTRCRVQVQRRWLHADSSPFWHAGSQKPSWVHLCCVMQEGFCTALLWHPELTTRDGEEVCWVLCSRASCFKWIFEFR